MKEENQKIKIGLVGCGFMGQSVHIPCFLNNKDSEILALSDNNREQGALVARRYGIPKFYDSAEEMFHDKDIEVVALIVPPQLNPDLAIKAMEAHKHVYAEKPIALSLNEALRMIATARKNNVRFMGAYMKRYDPGCMKAKVIIDNFRAKLELGKITYARVHNFLGDWISGFSTPIITKGKKVAYTDIGILGIPDFIDAKHREDYFASLINFSHDINIMRFFLGDPKEINCSSLRKGPNIFAARTASLFNYGDFDACLETGCVSSHLWDEEAKIYFEKGWVEIKLPAPLLRNMPAEVTIYRNGHGIEQPLVEWGWSFQREVDYFIECIKTGKDFISDIKDCAKDLILAEAMYKSFKEKRNIEIDYSCIKSTL
jgi:predicted dehydrogenase